MLGVHYLVGYNEGCHDIRISLRRYSGQPPGDDIIMVFIATLFFKLTNNAFIKMYILLCYFMYLQHEHDIDRGANIAVKPVYITLLFLL